MTEPLQVQRFDARLHVGGEGLASPSMTARSSCGLLTTVHTTVAAHSSSEQAPSRACILS